MLKYRDLKFITAYLPGLQGRIARLHTDDVMHLHKQGINKLTIKKHALLHKNDHPQSLDKFFKSAAFKDGDKKILFPYTYKDSVTNIGVLCGGGIEVLQLTKLPGIFLGADIEKTAHVCQTEFEALLLRQLGVKDATVLTEPKALKLHNPSLITLVDSGQLSLAVGEALAYNRLYPNVNVLFLTDPISKHKDKTNIDKLIEKNTQPFYRWLTSKIMHDFCFDQDILREDLEAAEITDDEFALVMEGMKDIPNSDLIVEWLNTLDRTTCAIEVRGTKVVQTRAGWFIEGEILPLSNFRLEINKVKDVKNTRYADCSIITQESTYSMTVPMSKLGGRKSLDTVIQTYYSDIGRSNPMTDSGDIPIPGVSWLKLASMFKSYELVVDNYDTLGFEEFSELYNEIFEVTQYKRPFTRSHYSKSGKNTLGFWHHKSAELWLSKGRLLKAIKQLTGKHCSNQVLENCLGKAVKLRRLSCGSFYVFPAKMVSTKGCTGKIIEFQSQA